MESKQSINVSPGRVFICLRSGRIHQSVRKRFTPDANTELALMDLRQLQKLQKKLIDVFFKNILIIIYNQ